MSRSFSCPKCQSENAQSFPMIFQSGTTTATTTGLAYGGEVGLIGATSQTKSQSVLASRVIPPDQPSLELKDFVIGIVLMIGIMIISVLIGLSGLLPVILSLLGMVGFLAYRYFDSQKKQPLYQKQLMNWQNSWMCLKCGHSWKNNPLKK